MFVAGQRDVPPASLAQYGEERPLIRCGTPFILDFMHNYHRLDPGLLASMGFQDYARPILDSHYDTPSGEIKIHYATSGSDQVYGVNIDNNSNGIPDYVESVGVIADSVYDHAINILGYPRPPVDTACDSGEDRLIDIYLIDFGGHYYGKTWADTLCSLTPDKKVIPGWVEFDNDYQEIEAYMDRPLDAIRVTLAHEFFHLVQFGIDFMEFRGWMEMSAVWMEEEQYDHMNDYYSVLHYFFDRPRISLQDPDLYHQYGSSVFPIYLAERHGRDIIKDIWFRCGELGTGSDWLKAVDEVVDSAASRWICTEGSFDTTCYDSAWLLVDLAYALREFAVWNYFTGPYSGWAPDDIGYSEKENYPVIPDSAIKVHKQYPDTVIANENFFNPRINASTYIRLENLQDVLPESWVCDSGSFDTVCYDSTWVFRIFYYVDSRPQWWGVSTILQFENLPDSHVVESRFVSGIDDLVGILAGQYRTATLVFTPATTDTSVFYTGSIQGLGYALLDTNFLSPDPTLANLTPAHLIPYPNPAVVSRMGTGAASDKGRNIWFRFQVPTDSAAELIYETPVYKVDMYTVAGELVRTREMQVPGTLDRDTGPPQVIYEIDWDMKNASGRDVASGVYLVYARLYSSEKMMNLLAEARAKVAIIR